MRRNLIYFIYPYAINDEWRKCLKELSDYLAGDIFNGRRIITVALDEYSHSLSSIREFLAGIDVDYVEVENNPMLGETPYFLHSLDMVCSLDPGEITFYAHAKGVSRGKRDVRAITHWRQRMLKHCLEDIDHADNIMQAHGVAGCFRRLGSAQPRVDPPVSWHFSGSYYWLNHARLFNRDWTRIHNSRWGTEAYPAYQFSKDESFCFYADDFPVSPYTMTRAAQWLQLDEAEKKRPNSV